VSRRVGAFTCKQQQSRHAVQTGCFVVAMEVAQFISSFAVAAPIASLTSQEKILLHHGQGVVQVSCVEEEGVGRLSPGPPFARSRLDPGASDIVDSVNGEFVRETAVGA